MTKANIGLGVLSIPFVFMEVGMVPGVILLLVLALIVMCEFGLLAALAPARPSPPSRLVSVHWLTVHRLRHPDW